jgi:antimicrobial peptide system SdpB family protein
LTLIFSPSSSIFRPATGLDGAPVCTGARAATLFCLVPRDRLEIARWCAVAILLVVASGWRPRITGILHWWVSFGFFATGVVIDGGDQCAGILSLLLIPVTLTDPRRWHWDPAPVVREEKRMLVARVALAVTRLQVAGIYFHASVGKLPVEEWADGTALYYWLLHPSLGAPGWLAAILRPLLLNGPFVALLTWSVLVLEISLFMGLIAPKPTRKWLLVAGVLLHSGIIVLHGLVSFGLTMFGALILLLRPFEQELDFAGWRAWLPRAARWGFMPPFRRDGSLSRALAPAPGHPPLSGAHNLSASSPSLSTRLST